MRRRSPTDCIFITGASGGIGAALAIAYAAPGKILILHGRDVTRLGELQRACEARGARVDLWVRDLADLDGLPEAVAELAGQYQIDLAVVNAGVTHHIGAGGEGESWADVEWLMAINARAAMATVSGLLPSMQRRGAGQIALVSSLSAWYGLALTPAYCASKAAIKAYGEALGGWLAPQGVEVAVVLPGFVMSAMSERFPGPRPWLMSADRAARIIRRGLERRRARIAFPLPLDLGMRCLSVLPAGLSRGVLTLLGYTRQ